MVDFDELYRENSAVFGNGRPSGIVVRAASLVGKRRPSALDLGAGQGRDTLYLLGKGFDVVAVDGSSVAMQQINARVGNTVRQNLTTKIADLSNYEIDKKYDLIISILTLHFLPRQRIVELIGAIQQSINKNGVIAIEMFLTKNGLAENELKELFSGFELVKYEENVRDDPGHAGDPLPHKHYTAKLIAKRLG